MALVAAIATCSFLAPEDARSGTSRYLEFLSAKPAAPLALSLSENHGKLPVASLGLKPILLAPFAARFLATVWCPKLFSTEVVPGSGSLRAAAPRLVDTVELRI